MLFDSQNSANNLTESPSNKSNVRKFKEAKFVLLIDSAPFLSAAEKAQIKNIISSLDILALENMIASFIREEARFMKIRSATIASSTN